MELTKIDISPDVVDAEDVEMLSDLIIAATNEALRAARKEKGRHNGNYFRRT